LPQAAGACRVLSYAHRAADAPLPDAAPNPKSWRTRRPKAHRWRSPPLREAWRKLSPA